MKISALCAGAACAVLISGIATGKVLPACGIALLLAGYALALSLPLLRSQP